MWALVLRVTRWSDVSTDATHLSDEDPDQPQASREEGEEDVEDERSEAVATVSGH